MLDSSLSADQLARQRQVTGVASCQGTHTSCLLAASQCAVRSLVFSHTDHKADDVYLILC
jgi:hypothetical protein